MRAVPEWIAKNDDQAIPKAVKLRIWAREGGRCHITGRKILPSDLFDYDHKKPLADGGGHRESNLFLALRDKHREKTSEENSDRAKADRVHLKHIGQWPSSPFKLRSRGFAKRSPDQAGR